MKIGVVGDIHWSRYSSIVRLRGEVYSYRLENCIKSVNWAEQLLSNCDIIVYLGDFFDSSELNSEEITALKDIVWNSVPHYFLVGNHEMGINNLSYSSSHLFSYINTPSHNNVVVDFPQSQRIEDVTLHFIPYILEEHRKPIAQTINKSSDTKNIIFSHNDLAGIQLGKYLSTQGFSLQDIDSSCDLYFNGHLHNGGKITDKIINVGNLTGQNFSEDAFQYKHSAIILDTDTMSSAVYDNPYALNFYKLDLCESEYDLSSFTSPSVLTIKLEENQYDKYVDQVEHNSNIIAHRFIIVQTQSEDNSVNNKEIIAVNHLDKFKNYVLETLGTSDLVLGEIEEVIK